MMVVPTEDWHFCESCLTVRPVSDFRRRSRHGEDRLNQCRTCHNEAERVRRAALRQRSRDHRISQFTLELKNADRPAQIEVLCAGIIAEFGGLAAFVGAWADYGRRLHEEHPESKKAGDFFRTIANLIQYCDDHRQMAVADVPNATDLSEDELQAQLSAAIEDLVRNQPELAIAAVERLGWTAGPPQ